MTVPKYQISFTRFFVMCLENLNFPRFKTIVLLLIIITISSACLDINFRNKEAKSYEPQCVLNYSGQLRQSLITQIGAIGKCDGILLKINSHGGESYVSLAIARVIQDRNINIVVDKYCISACAEFLLPAAKSVKFINNPLIGFHGNPVMRQALSKIYSPPGIENCSFEDAWQMKQIYEKAGTSINFWEIQMSRLELKSFMVSDAEATGVCPHMQPKFKNAMWYPTSKTLKTYLKLSFEGIVCSDIKSCGAKDIAFLYTTGSHMIGDRLVVLN